MNSLRKSIIALVAATALSMFSVGAANAAPSVAAVTAPARTAVGTNTALTSSGLNITDAQFKQGIKELKASPLPRAVSETPEGKITTFTLEAEGKSLQFSVVEPKYKGVGSSTGGGSTPRGAEPRIGGGIDGGGLYILLNQFDQDLVIAGTGFVLGAAICAIPGVGTAACVIVGAVLAVAGVWLSYNGKCKNNKQLKVYAGRVGGCV